jgi:disulfide bond formation protein DsbB
MLRIVGILIAAAGIAALFGPRRLRLVFWLIVAAGATYAALRLTGWVSGPEPVRMG